MAAQAVGTVGRAPLEIDKFQLECAVKDRARLVTGMRVWSRFVTVVVGLRLEVLAELVYAHVCVYADVHVYV